MSCSDTQIIISIASGITGIAVGLLVLLAMRRRLERQWEELRNRTLPPVKGLFNEFKGRPSPKPGEHPPFDLWKKLHGEESARKAFGFNEEDPYS
jgi:hypothetical protein